MKHTFSDTLVMLAELTIKPEKRDEFLDYTLENLEISREAAGNITFDILIDEARPDQVLFYEVWESAEADASAMSKMATDCGPLSASIRPLKPAAQPIAKNSGCVLDSIY